MAPAPPPLSTVYKHLRVACQHLLHQCTARPWHAHNKYGTPVLNPGCHKGRPENAFDVVQVALLLAQVMLDVSSHDSVAKLEVVPGQAFLPAQHSIAQHSTVQRRPDRVSVPCTLLSTLKSQQVIRQIGMLQERS
jgi:hypothetical protein